MEIDKEKREKGLKIDQPAIHNYTLNIYLDDE